MWDDAKIGKGNYGNMSVRICDVEKGNVSENSVSYWITDCICNMGMVVMKDTQEGQKITDMISKGITNERLQDYLDKILLKRASVQTLKNRIDAAVNEAHEKGKRMKADEIRRVLGLNRYY